MQSSTSRQFGLKQQQQQLGRNKHRDSTRPIATGQVRSLVHTQGQHEADRDGTSATPCPHTGTARGRSRRDKCDPLYTHRDSTRPIATGQVRPRMHTQGQHEADRDGTSAIHCTHTGAARPRSGRDGASRSMQKMPNDICWKAKLCPSL